MGAGDVQVDLGSDLGPPVATASHSGTLHLFHHSCVSCVSLSNIIWQSRLGVNYRIDPGLGVLFLFLARPMD